jgi:3-dehydroquinate dehydratase/shikimate dehydrogenase
MLFKDRICAVIAAPTAALMMRLEELARRRTRMFEIRFDYLRDDDEFNLMLKWLARRKDKALRIATHRRREDGGEWGGTLGGEAARIAMAPNFGCRWRDIALSVAERFGPAQLKRRLGRAPIIVSHHDFRRTPANLAALARRLERAGGDAAKIAAACRSYADGLRLLALCRRRKNMIVVPMGEIGRPLRVLALREGSALAYAPVSQATAPGQISLEEMTSLYRAASITRKTRVFGVIGDPVAHSLSPVMHNRAFQALGINAVYLPFLVRDLRDFLRAARPLGLAGFSVTLPHKERILEHLDECEPLAARIGAVNTVVVRRNGKLFGMNTDFSGLLRALEKRVRLAGARVLLLGAGGVARAAAFGLAAAGAEVFITARRFAAGKNLARAAGGEAVARERVRGLRPDIIVNCTPVGMAPHDDQSPLEARELNARLVFDTVYRPLETRLLRMAAARGIATQSGLEMFIAQGAAQFEVWTGSRAPERVMRRAIANSSP